MFCLSAAVLLTLQPAVSSASSAPAPSAAGRIASLGSLRSRLVNCDGSMIKVLTPPAGRGMPLAALAGRPVSAGLAAQERPGVHWLIPRCATGHREAKGSATGAAPAPAIVPASGEENSGDWSGFITTATGYEATQSQWTVPAVGGGCGSGCNSYSSIFAALGPQLNPPSSSLLVQAGTEQDLAPSASYYAFWQACCYQQSQQVISNFPVHPGNLMFAEVVQSGARQAQITIEDDSTHQATNITANWPASYTLSTHAEWILERTALLVGSRTNYPPLADIGAVNWANAYATDSSGDTAALGDFKRDYLYMLNCAATETLAETGDLSNGGLNFPVNWFNFGPRELAC